MSLTTTFTKRGKVWLGTKSGDAFPAGAQFDTDPKISLDWPQRRSVFENVGGGVTHQDFGQWAADLKLLLKSDKNYISHANKAYLDNLTKTRGVSYDYKDYTGIEATVVILAFKPEPTFIGDSRGVLWEYEMVLQVMDLSVYDFAAYTGN
jgi:hypothetical protein